jgi:biopolymer transport protein TolR
MKQSRRTKRMQLHHARRNDRNASLNMVSLMDIFTILVFFLLVSAADTQVLPSPKQIKLPESTAEKAPKENIIIMVSSSEILVQGQKVATINGASNRAQPIIPELLNDLKRRAAEKSNTNERRTNPKQGVTIMGDKRIPYQLLKKIMLTCASADYTNISLAVTQKAAPRDDAS